MIKLIQWIKAHKLLSVLCVIAIFALPLLIVHCLFKWHSGYEFLNAEWTAGDVLGYIAGFEAFLGTVALGALALWQNHLFREDNLRKERYAIRPYLFSTVQDEHIDLLAESHVGDIEFLDIKILENQSVQIACANRNKPADVVDYTVAKQAYLDFVAQQPESEKITQTVRRTELITNEVNALCALNEKYVLCSYAIENHGIGSAVKINLQMNSQPAMPLFCLSHLEKKQLYLLINAENLVPGKMASLSFSIAFYNIEDFGPYMQCETLSVRRMDSGALSLVLDKQISEPILENKEATINDNT